MRTVLPLAALLALAACNSEPEVELTDAAPGQVANGVAASGAADTFLNPGQWQSTVILEDMTVPGMPPEAVQQMQATLDRTEVTESCLTPEKARKPVEDFFAGAQKGCTYKRFSMARGTLDAEMTCEEGGATMAMTLAGTYSPDSYAARMTMTGSGPNGGEGMTMKLSVAAQRVGDCA